MENKLPNIFQRQDTLFGICEAVGQDFGFNPTWLRLAFVAPLFFFPVQSILGYLGLGVVVLASRTLFPDKSAAAPVAASLAVIEGDMQPATTNDGIALAA